ncbi:MAG: response regulator [Desulfobacteraceae bacterium]|nr:response regulator [Desulfobacteraceae bacterium]
MKILIVDDDRTNRLLMETLLTNSGHAIAQAENGETALEMLKQEKFDLIISDILMPVMDGYRLCRECKKDENLKNIPVIFCSGTYTSEKDETLAARFGAAAFISKPFQNQDLLAVIAQAMEHIGDKGANAPGIQDDDEKGVYQLYSERLIQKLEKKMQDLDKQRMALEMEMAERIKAEKRLIEYRDFAETLFNAAPGIVLILDTEGRILRFNPYMELVSGYRLEDVRGRYWMDVFSPENAGNGFSGNEARDNGHELPTGNLSSIVTRAGEKREILWFDAVLKNEDGKVIGLLAVGQDITRQRKKTGTPHPDPKTQ